MPVLNTAITLKDLPPPPSGKVGWPWTEAIPIPKVNDSLPRLTIVTPSYNQGQFLEETIRSVLLQGYPNLEYAIVDGGSTDGSVEIIKKYAPFLSYWISEPDGGQSFAINKGFKQTSGQIVAWLNSDDHFSPGILLKIAQIFVSKSTVNLITCPVRRITAQGETICITNPPKTNFEDIFFWSHYMPQAGVFFRRTLLEKVGYLDESLHLQMDYDLWFRFAKETKFYYYKKIAANIKIHPEAKTTAGKYKTLSKAESLAVKLRHADERLKKQILNGIASQLVEDRKLRNSFWVRLLKKLKLI